jgi:hypothetical protein
MTGSGPRTLLDSAAIPVPRKALSFAVASRPSDRRSFSLPAGNSLFEPAIGSGFAHSRPGRRQKARASTPYVGDLESNKRHPSDNVLARLAKVLDLDPRVLFMSANPIAAHLIKSTAALNGTSAWDALRKDKKVQRLHNITPVEMKFLSQVAEMGEVPSLRDFLQVLNVIRHALGQ